MQVSGEMMVFRNEHESSKGKWYSYATTIAKKREDGSWLRTRLDVMFRKDVVVENKTRINVKDGFLTVREYTKDGQTKTIPVAMVLDFEEMTGNSTGFTALSMDDVPF